MKRWVVGLLALCALSTAQAQTFYVGGSLALLTDGRYSSPFIGVQVGGALGLGVELRAALETQLYASGASVDLLYRSQLKAGLSGYGGVGADLLILPLMQPTPAVALATPLGEGSFTLHGTLGLEARPSQIGFFGEVQPTVTLNPARLGSTKLRAGVNFYF